MYQSRMPYDLNTLSWYNQQIQHNNMTYWPQNCQSGEVLMPLPLSPPAVTIESPSIAIEPQEPPVPPKRLRTSFTDVQLETLEKKFSESRYICGPRRKELANELNLTPRQINVWFNNRRMSDKKARANIHERHENIVNRLMAYSPMQSYNNCKHGTQLFENSGVKCLQ